MVRQVRLERTEGAGIVRLTAFIEPIERAERVAINGKEWTVKEVYQSQSKDRLAWWLKTKKV